MILGGLRCLAVIWSEHQVNHRQYLGSCAGSLIIYILTTN